MSSARTGSLLLVAPHRYRQRFHTELLNPAFMAVQFLGRTTSHFDAGTICYRCLVLMEELIYASLASL